MLLKGMPAAVISGGHENAFPPCAVLKLIAQSTSSTSLSTMEFSSAVLTTPPARRCAPGSTLKRVKLRSDKGRAMCTGPIATLSKEAAREWNFLGASGRSLLWLNLLYEGP